MYVLVAAATELQEAEGTLHSSQGASKHRLGFVPSNPVAKGPLKRLAWGM